MSVNRNINHGIRNNPLKFQSLACPHASQILSTTITGISIGICKKVIDFLLFNITTPCHILGIVLTGFFDGILPSDCFIFSISLCSFHSLQILFHLFWRGVN